MVTKKLVIHYFCEIFGVEPYSVNDYEHLIQLRFNFSEIKKKHFYIALKQLKKIVEKNTIIKILFISDIEMQVIVGEAEAVNRLNLEANSNDIILDLN